MKLSTSLNVYGSRCGGTSVEAYLETVKRAKKCGFKTFDFNCGNYEQQGSWYKVDNWRDNVKKIKEAADEMGVEFYQSHAAMFTEIITENTEEMFAETYRSIEAAALAGAKWTAIHCYSTGIADEEEDIKKNIELLTPYAEFASKMGIGLAVENNPERIHWYGEVMPQGNFHKTENIIRVSDALNERFGNVGVCWDTGHANLTFKNQYDELIKLGKRLKIMHIADNYNQHDDHMPPFYGLTDFKQIMKALKDIGYEGTFNYETHKFTSELPDELIDDAVKLMYKIGEYIVNNY